MIEQTLIIIKPDGVVRGLVGKIIERFEAKGLQIAAAKLAKIDRSTAQKHYAVHKDKDFFNRAVDYISSGPVLLMVLQGNDAISCCRKMMGATFANQAEAGTIRGDFGISKCFNLVHGSDSPESAKAEIPLYFTSEEILSYQMPCSDWL